MDEKQKKLVGNLRNALQILKASEYGLCDASGVQLTRDDVISHVQLLTDDYELLNPSLKDRYLDIAEAALDEYESNQETLAKLPPYEREVAKQQSFGANENSEIFALNSVYEPSYDTKTDTGGTETVQVDTVVRSEMRDSIRQSISETLGQFTNQNAQNNFFSPVGQERGGLQGNLASYRNEVLARARDKIMDKFKSSAFGKAVNAKVKAVFERGMANISKSAIGGVIKRLGPQIAAQLGLGAVSGGASLVVQGALWLKGQIGKLFKKFGSVFQIKAKQGLSKRGTGMAIGSLLLAPLGIGSALFAGAALGLGAAAFWAGGAGAFGSAIAGIAGVAAAILAAVAGMAVVPIVATMIGLPLLTAFMILVITASSYVTQPAPPISFVEDRSGGETGGGGGGGSTVEGCEGLVLNAESIANDLTTVPGGKSGYTHGFWDYWNHNSSYPNYWIQNYYNVCYNVTYQPECLDSQGYWVYPGTSNRVSIPYTLFWCTALVAETYNSAGFPMSYGQVALVGSMKYWFDTRGKFEEASTPAEQVPEGSVVFISNNEDGEEWAHVGMITNISGGVVTIAEANSWSGKPAVNNVRLSVGAGGTIVSNYSDYPVRGFGFPPDACYY